LIDTSGHMARLQQHVSVRSIAPEELAAPDFLQDALAVGTAGNQSPAVAQRKRKRATIDALRESNLAQVDQQRALDPHKAQRREHSGQVLHGVAREIALVINMQSHVVCFRLHVVDVLDINEVEALRLLSRDLAQRSNLRPGALRRQSLAGPPDSIHQPSSINRLGEIVNGIAVKRLHGMLWMSGDHDCEGTVA